MKRTTRIKTFGITLLANVIFIGLSILVYDSMVASGQETRTYIPQGFEFGVTTPAFKYHFPKAKHKGTVFKGTWIAENADEIQPNYEIDSAEIKPGELPVVNFTLNKPSGDWPRGLYRLEIRMDGTLIHTERFIVR